MTAPIVLFVYNRPWHTRQTVTALQNNELASQSNLIVFSDAPKNPEASQAVGEVRDFIHTITGFLSLQIIERERNYGLANSIISGVTEIIEKHGQVIVLEDDMVTSPYFLEYMNMALELYRYEDRVISIHGYMYPVVEVLPEFFFLRGADCWGWATWRRGWQLFEKDGRKLLEELKRRKLVADFDFNGAYPYTKMLQDQIAGRNDSWAIRWHASAFLQDKLTLYSGRSLVHNIGNDDTGTHCSASTKLDVRLSNAPILLKKIAIVPSEVALREIGIFLRQSVRNNLAQRVKKALSLLKY